MSAYFKAFPAIDSGLTFSLCILIFSFYGFFVLEGSLFRFLYVLFIVYLLHREIELLKRLMLKNPIFIVDKTRLYYIKTNKWYDLNRHTFENRTKSRYDWDRTFCVIDPMEYEVITESNWYLSEEDSLFSAIKYYKSQYHLNINLE